MTNPPNASTASTGVRQFERACTYCGARFAVTVSRKPLPGALHHYDCPECGKTSEIYSSLAPVVRLASLRTDGKSDNYQETLF